ncbi:MAG: hypothetical protein ABIU77_22390, partial [Ferruginibacter sp.]
MFNKWLIHKTFSPIIFSIIAFFFFQPLKAQSFTSDNWSKPNLLGFDTGWKFKSGIAQPEYFKRDFHDENWQSVTYKFLDTIAPGTNAFQNVGTIRRKFYVPDSMKDKAAELFFNQVGASEIYFDGKQIFKTGQINGSVKNTIVSQRSVPLILDSLPWHVLSIYYSSTISENLITVYRLRGIGITMFGSQNKSGDHNDPYHHIIISLGIIAGFGLFFWFVFAFYPNRRASLLSAVMLTNFALIFLGALIRDINEPTLNQFVLGEKFWEIGFSTTFGWWLLVMYSLYYEKLTWYNLIAVIMMCTSIIMIITEFKTWFIPSVVFLSLYLIEALRISIKGIVKGKTGFWILATGLLLSIIGTLTVIFNIFKIFPDYLTPIQTILGIANDLIFPLTLALHLAWEFGSANRDLKKQLVHVNQLSKQNIEQEQEKQQILATQNETLEQQVKKRTFELNNSLNELKSTQAQLIQSEKMASLGELTAGIAHEIQNPLNFVNNFSEVNKEMLEELKSERLKPKAERDEQLEDEIINDVIGNEQKINHHGKRADAIVKGMLQHSQSSTGQKEPTDINKLADEYLHLSYHGLRAKDKSFNATLKTYFDDSIGKINIIPQDIGRVLLNLYNNAFYAVNEKRKSGIKN